MSLRFGLAMMSMTPACSEFFALDGKGKGVRLYKRLDDPRFVGWQQVGQTQTHQELDFSSTCADTKIGRIYYAASVNGVLKLCGMDTSDGTVAVEVELPQLLDYDSDEGHDWKLGCDSKHGLVYVIFDYKSTDYDDFCGVTVDRTVWRYDGASFESAFTFKGSPCPFCYARQGGNIQVNPEDGLLSIVDNHMDDCDLTVAVHDAQTGSILLESPYGLAGSPCAQVYDSGKNRFFGLCNCDRDLLYTVCSCWWTDKEQPHMMATLSDYTECGENLNTIDPESRIGWFNVHGEVAVLSLDTGEKLDSFSFPSVGNFYHFVPSTPTDGISV